MKYVSEDLYKITAKCENCFDYIEISKSRCKTASYGYKVDNLIKCRCGNYSSTIDILKEHDSNKVAVNKNKTNSLVSLKPIIITFVIAIVGICILKSITDNNNSSTLKSINSTVSVNSNEKDSLYSNESKSSNIWTKTAGNTNGYDWVNMNYAQKNDIVSGVILTWKNSGRKIDVDAEWFIDGLNNFYGTEATNNTNLALAMSMIGTTGEVIN